MSIAGPFAVAWALSAVVGVADGATSHHTRHHARRSSTAGSTSSSSSSSTPGRPPNGESELSGETAAKAKAAALAAVPGGTVLRASTEDPSDPSKAAYEVHVRKSDGSEVAALLDSSFKVLAVNAAPAHGRDGCPGGPPRAGGPPPAGAGSGAPSGSSLSMPAPQGSAT